MIIILDLIKSRDEIDKKYMKSKAENEFSREDMYYNFFNEVEVNSGLTVYFDVNTGNEESKIIKNMIYNYDIEFLVKIAKKKIWQRSLS